MGFIVRDDKKRVLIQINDDGRYIIGRYPDMTVACKNFIVKWYKDVGGKESDAESLIRFLNFEEDRENFCS